jgi:hypothetical protein
MKPEKLVIRPKRQKLRIGVLPTYAQRDRTKYTRKTKHRGQEFPGNHNAFLGTFLCYCGNFRSGNGGT